MALSPRAMLAFGEMYRRAGRADDGTAVLSGDWVEASFRSRTRSPFSGLDYGYGWFLGRRSGQRLALARGYGGQIVALVPDLGMTVVITSDTSRPARSEGYFGDLMRPARRGRDPRGHGGPHALISIEIALAGIRFCNIFQ